MARIGEATAPAATREALGKGADARLAGAGPADRGPPHRQHRDRRLAWPPQARHRREFLAVPALCRRRGDRPHRLAAFGPRRSHLCARPRMAGRPYRLAVGRSVAVDALQVPQRDGLQGIARAGADPGASPSFCRAAASASPGRASPIRSRQGTAPSGWPRIWSTPASFRPSPTFPRSAASPTS